MADRGSASSSTHPRQRLLERFGYAGSALLLCILFIGIAAWFHVVHGEFPWDKGILKRASQHLPPRVRDYKVIGLWWGCLASGIISIALLLGARWWMPGRDRPDVRAGGFSIPRCLALPLVAILALATWLRAPLLSHSLWNDEEYAMRKHAHGHWTEDGNERREFHPVTWDETLFDCHTGNNHHFSALAARASLGAWHRLTGAPREDFSETALRFPSLIAGLATMVLVMLLGCEMGLPWVGCAAAGLLAIHPWHLRVGVEARGYAFMLFFLCLALLGLIRALRCDSIASWLAFAVGEAGCLLSFAGSLYPVAALSLFAALELLRKREARRITTLVGFNLLAAIPVLVWLLPSVPQILAYLERADNSHLREGWDWLHDLATFLLSGAHFSLPDMNLHLGTTWSEQSRSSLLFGVLLGWVLPGLLATGLTAALFRNTATRLAIGSIVFAAVVAYLHNWMKASPMMITYLIYLLIPVCLAVPLAISCLPGGGCVQVPVTVLLLASYAWATRDVSQRLREHDRQPMRQTAAYIHQSDPKAMTAVFGVSGFNTRSYDPFVRVLETDADLDAALLEAGRKGRPLYVYFCGRTASLLRGKQIMQRIMDRSAFEPVRDFPGLEELFSYHVFRAVR